MQKYDVALKTLLQASGVSILCHSRPAIRKGLEQGMQQGKAEGLQEGRLSIMHRLVKHRFGSVPE